MARVSAIAKGHTYLAAVEGYLAHHAATDKQRTLERIHNCFGVATSRGGDRSYFTEEELAILQLAWLSAQTPLLTPQRFIEPLTNHFNPQEIIQLLVVCAIASLVQRFVAIAQPEMEPEVSEFIKDNSLALDALALRYPLPQG